MFSAYFNLMPYDVDIHVIQPIQHLASYERFYIAASTLMFCQCFHNEEITSAVDKESNTNLRLTVSGRTFTDKDVVYNIRQGIPGDVLHRCSPFFHDKTTGLSQELLLEVLSVHFDTTFVLEGVLFYNGPAKYIINDYRAYFRDIYPLFSPTSSVPKSSDLYKVAEYNNDLRRSRRHKVVKRKTYTTTYHELGNKVKLNSESSYTSTIQALLQTPRLRYEFDLMSNTHYNTSFSYYKHLRQYVESDVLDFSKPIHHSGFKVVPGITMIEVLRNINPFDMYIPRMNIIREFIGGYDVVGEIRKLRDVARSASQQLEYAPLRTLVGLLWLASHPSDQTGYNALASGDLSPEQSNKVFSSMYRLRYARVPIMLVVRDNNDIQTLTSMFVVHVRQTTAIKSWSLYSPILITDSISLIPSASYSICVSQKIRNKEVVETVFGPETNSVYTDNLFMDACDLATIHVTYDDSLQELLENEYMPDRVKSLMSTTVNETYNLPSGGAYDPILSEVITIVEPSHATQVSGGVRNNYDESVLEKSNVPDASKRTSLPAHEFLHGHQCGFVCRNTWPLVGGTILLLSLIITSSVLVQQICRDRKNRSGSNANDIMLTPHLLQGMREP